ncbi:MAG: hypothetical protein ACYC96_07550 [Fimbriimonadaceae bacterium]
MVPLAIGTRSENLIVYYSQNWEELPCLLEAPLEFLRGQQFLFEQDPNLSINWQLLTPLTATIECGYANPVYLATIVAVLGPKVTGQYSTTLEATPDALWNETVLTYVATQLAGSFFVEFATYTNSIRIIYFPPLPQPAAARYQGGISTATMVTASACGRSYANVHFDLNETSHRMRADFIVTHLELPPYVANSLTAEAASGTMAAMSCQLTQAQDPKGLLGPVQPTVPPTTVGVATQFSSGISLAATVPANLPAKDAAGVARFYRKYQQYPTVIAHNLSDPMELYVCINITCLPKPATNTVELGTMIVESYARVLYDPCFVVNRCAPHLAVGGVAGAPG